MQTGIAAASISSTIASATDCISLSKPTMKPAVTNRPAAYSRWMLSAMLRRVFCFLRIAMSVVVSGLSMPTKTHYGK